ncbi:MAG: penicillin-binding protein 2 [Clostridiales bacterium]|jgi:peptidoglycan glycosyltransferase|nr:penicillin-binding protein 2 [Clostridiales bacterium]
MEEIRKNIRRVFWLYFALFAALAIYLIKFIVFDSKGIITSPYNPRLKLRNPSVTRGDIIDSGGKKLAYTAGDGRRVYESGVSAAHAVGYCNAGVAGFYGVEAKYNFELQTVGNELYQQFRNLFAGDIIMGGSAVLTIDAELQAYIHDLIKDYRSGVIILEPTTGKILAMNSAPGFDPNTLTEDFSRLSADSDSPLINRAAQGQYPPGSVFKIVTAAAAIEFMPDYADFEYHCEGEAIIGGKSVRCYNSTAHGDVKLDEAFALSCNTYFSTIGLQIGADNLRSLSERFFFNETLPFPLEYSVSGFPLDAASDSAEIVDTAIGQGRIMASPLQMALITAAVANNGIIMSPYILDRIVSYDGKSVRKTIPYMAKQAFSPDVASTLTRMMTDVTEYGTGARVSVSNVEIAAKTGSAQNPNGDDHGWYTAFFPAENPQYVVSIVIENIGGSSRVLPIAKNLVEHLTNLGK